jgi:hypothetical protein
VLQQGDIRRPQETLISSFDGSLRRTEGRETRGASRGECGFSINNAVSLSLRFGLRSMGFLLVGGKSHNQKLRAEGMRFWGFKKGVPSACTV